MNTTVSKTLAVIAVIALPFAGSAMAGQSASGAYQVAQSSGQVPPKCAAVKNVKERAECIREHSGK